MLTTPRVSQATRRIVARANCGTTPELAEVLDELLGDELVFRLEKPDYATLTSHQSPELATA